MIAVSLLAEPLSVFWERHGTRKTWNAMFLLSIEDIPRLLEAASEEGIEPRLENALPIRPESPRYALEACAFKYEY